jgi:hypothetical protein
LSAGGAGDEGSDDVGRVPVEGLAAPVVAHGRARVGVTGRFLHVTQRHSGVERGGFQRLLWGGDSGVPWLFTR